MNWAEHKPDNPSGQRDTTGSFGLKKFDLDGTGDGGSMQWLTA